MGKRYMTIDDLYNFCLKNNFCKFSSAESNNDEIIVQMPAMFEVEDKSEDRFTEGMTPFVSRAFHDHINLNKSEIKEDSFIENLPSSHLRPILAHIVKDEETGELDFGSHDFHIDEDGNWIYDEQPVGVIDGTKTTVEYDEKAGVNRAVLRGFLYDGYCQDAVDIINRRKETAVSVELAIREMSFNTEDNVLTLDDWYVTALTILGELVSPGMAGSNLKIEDFSAKNSSVVENLDNSVNEKLVELLESLNEKLSNFNINNSNGKEDSSMESVEMKFEDEVTTIEEEVTETEESTKEEEVVTVTEEETEETVEETPVVEEEVEEKFDEEDADDAEESEEPEDIEPQDLDDEDEDEEEFEPIPGDDEEPEVKVANEAHKFTISNGNKEVSFEVSHEDIRYALYNLISIYEEQDNDWYGIQSVFDDHFIMISWCTDTIYGQKYTVDGDNVALEGERWRLYAEYVTETEKAALEEMRSNYSLIQSELAKYKAAEDREEKAKLLDNVEAYEVLADDVEYKKLKGEADKYSKEELFTKADLIFARFMKSNAPAKVEKKSKTVNFSSLSKKEDKEKSKKPYGGIFENYNKK